jgi:hypothetical protein
MTGSNLPNRRTVAAAFSLLVAGCSGSSTGTGGSGSETGGGASSGTSSGDDSSSGGGSTGSSGSSSGASAGSSSGAGADDDGGTASGSVGGGDKDATVNADGASPKGGSTHDAAVHDGSTGDAATTGTVDGGDALAAARAQCVQIINQDRATLSPASPPLQEDTAEESCVDGEAQADYQANTPHSAFGNCSRESAQDECPNWPGPPSSIMTNCLAQMWAEGPPAAGQDNHWLNMSNAKYKKVACGFYQTPTGKWWATQDFY